MPTKAVAKRTTTTRTTTRARAAQAAPPADDTIFEAPEELGLFGEADEKDLAELRKPPIPFRIKGYDIDDPRPDKFEIFTFHVKPQMEFGPLFNALMAMKADGTVDIPVAVQFIGDAIIADDKQEFIDTMRNPALHFEASAIAELTQALATRYGMRPTLPRSARRSGPRRSGRTTTARR